MKRFEIAQAASLAQAAKQAATDGVVVKAGGVDLMDLMKEHLLEPDRLVSIQRVSGAREIREEGGAIVIGPTVTLAELAAHPIVQAKAKAVAHAAGDAATPQIRHQATCAGNLLQRPRCWYFRKEDLVCRRKGGPECMAIEGENRYHALWHNTQCAIVHPSNLAPALMLFDASVRTVRASGEKREVPLAKLFVTPEVDVHREHCLEQDEVIEAIVLPSRDGGAASEYRELREKQTFDWPLVSAAVRLAMDGKRVKEARVVLGAVCPVPLRREAAEKSLAGKELNEAVASQAAAAAFADAAPLSQNGYKVPAGTAHLARTILAAGGMG